MVNHKENEIIKKSLTQIDARGSWLVGNNNFIITIRHNINTRSYNYILIVMTLK